MVNHIETKRLSITALTPGQLELWINDIPMLEKELGCSYQAEPMKGVFKEIAAGQLELAKNAGENYIWYSFWFMIRKSDNVVVGSADFKNLPDKNGEVEIGYGLGKAFEHCGYMTETVQAMCDWARKQKGVRHIIAETDIDGYASQRILRRCGLKEYKRDITVWWRL